MALQPENPKNMQKHSIGQMKHQHNEIYVENQNNIDDSVREHFYQPSNFE